MLHAFQRKQLYSKSLHGRDIQVDSKISNEIERILFSNIFSNWVVEVEKKFVSLGFIAYSTFRVYLMPNSFLYKQIVLFQTIQFNISTQFNCQKHFYFKLFSLVKQF